MTETATTPTFDEIKHAVLTYEKQLPKIIDSAEMLIDRYDHDEAMVRMFLVNVKGILNESDLIMFLAITLIHLAENRKYIMSTIK